VTHCPACGIPQPAGNRFCASCGASLVGARPAMAAPTTWWGRNWKWVVPAGCLTLLAAFAGLLLLIFALAFGSLRSSEPYQQSVATALASPEVRELLGEPIEVGWFLSGTIHTAGAGGSAELAIPLAGPKGSGTLYVEAKKAAGEWRIELLRLVMADGRVRLDLLPGEEQENGEQEENDGEGAEPSRPRT
jgi:hypothetical protein